jgi:hypothetical protein
MSRFARVTSIDVLETLAGALQRFRGDAASAVDDLVVEIRRAMDWIHNDRKEYWKHEIRRGEDNVNYARLQLQQARMSRQIDGRALSCVDEERALARAKRHLEMVHEKVQAVQRWGRIIDLAADEFQRDRTQFTSWLETDLLQAVAALDRMSASLAAYISLQAPANPDMAIPGLPTTLEEEANLPATTAPSGETASSAADSPDVEPKSTGGEIEP